MSSSVHILILNEDPTQRLDDTTLSSERKRYSINFIESRKKLSLSLNYNGANGYLFVNDVEIIKFKAKKSKIVATPLCIVNVLKDFFVDNMKKAGFYGYEILFGFITAIGFIGLNAVPLKCVSVSNQECRIRSAIVNINSNKPLL